MDIGTIIVILVMGIIVFFLGTQLGLNMAGKILKKEAEEFKRQQKILKEKRIQLDVAAQEMREHSNTVDKLLCIADGKVAEYARTVLGNKEEK